MERQSSLRDWLAMWDRSVRLADIRRDAWEHLTYDAFMLFLEWEEHVGTVADVLVELD